MAAKQLICQDDCRRLLLAMAQQSATEDVLQVLVDDLWKRCGAALARVWLVAPKKNCALCRASELCDSQTECLQLVASAGQSLRGEMWSRVDGEFAQIPFGFGKIGHIAATRQPVEEKSIDPDARWIDKPTWIRREKIRGLIGQPLIHKDRLLGVLATFTRDSPSDDDLAWLRAFADHAAITISNSRAFVEIQELRSQLQTETEYLRSEVKEIQAYGVIVGDSPVINNMRERISLIAPTDATVLVQGASGTGKELVARAIHEQSRRAGRPMVTVNCAAIPRDLFESEFFGHVKGAFSGATQDRSGRFQLADKGTLLLDEVGDLPMEMQGKLLRVLEQGTFDRVGDESTVQVDVRVIAATNRDLATNVAEGRFRNDLYHRLSVMVIDVPALTDRLEDIPILARHFLRLYCRKYRVKEPQLTRAQLEQLEAYWWPGNVRELRNVVERAVISSLSKKTGKTMDFGHLSAERSPPAANRRLQSMDTLLTDAEIRRLERDNLTAILKHTKWKISGAGGAAEFLGVHPATLASRLRAMKIVRSHSEQLEEPPKSD